MDYIRLKKTLIAVFDHFLSCHDMAELEEMMQAFEAGQSLVIKLPEPIDRSDYKDDIERMDAAMDVPKPKKIVSRVRRRKPKAAMKTDIKQIKICDVPVLIDLQRMSKEKREALKDVLSGKHHAQIHDFTMSDIHGFAKLRVFKVVEADEAIALVRSFVPKGTQDDSSFSCGGVDGQPHQPFTQDSFSSFSSEQVRQKIESHSDRILRENLIQKIMFEIKKHKDPP